MKKKILSILGMIIIMVILYIIVGINNVKAETISGEAYTYNYIFDTETGTLTFSGTGVLQNRPAWTNKVPYLDVKHIKIEEGIEKIGGNDSFFGECTNLEDIEFPDSLKEIGYYSICNCTNLKNVILPKNLEKMTWGSFGGCSSLTSITIPKSVIDTDANPFNGCKNLKEILVEEGNANYISKDGVLYNKDMTKLISYPIGKNQMNFDIPDSVKEIGLSVFIDNTNLKQITIPNSVKEIAYSAFQDQNDLTIYCKSDNQVIESFKHCNVIYDDAAPEIGLKQQDNAIVVTATDSGAGLNAKAYSTDNKNWFSNNTIAVEKSGTYTIYVKDKLDNIANKNIDITVKENNDKKDEEKNEGSEVDKEVPKTDDTSKEDVIQKDEDILKNDEPQNKEPSKNENTPSKDTSTADKEFGQYGSSSLIVLFVIVTSVLAYIGYKKLKY